MFQQSHFAPYYEKVKEIINSGKLGNVFEVHFQFSGFSRRWDWQCSSRFYAGNLLNTCPHPMEMALDLLDTYISEDKLKLPGGSAFPEGGFEASELCMQKFENIVFN